MGQSRKAAIVDVGYRGDQKVGETEIFYAGRNRHGDFREQAVSV
jgi:hypothetical protein